MPHEVEAAGCVVRCGDRIAVIHRPRYDDWSLPKGKLDPGETFEEAAVREIHEEIDPQWPPATFDVEHEKARLAAT